MLDIDKSLPNDPDELRQFTALLLAEVKSQAVLIEKLRHQLAGHRNHRFGASSESIDQLQLALETSEIAVAKMTAKLYAVEKEARGSPPDRRVELRQAQAKPIFDDLQAWLHAQLPSISGKSPLAGAIRYALTRMARLQPYLDHGVLELDNNTAERAMRSVAIGRKNYLFVGSQTGGRAAAIAYTLIETAKLNGVDPQAWLADTLARIPDYKINRVDDLLPWKAAS